MTESEEATGRPPRPSPSKEELNKQDTSSSGEAVPPVDVANAKAILDAAKKDADDAAAADLDAPPLHLHTLREPARLQGTPGLHRARSRSGSRSRTSSRDASPSPSSQHQQQQQQHHHRRTSSGYGTPADPVPGTLEEPPSHAATTASSVSGGSDAGSDIDPDILLDRLALDDLEPPAPHDVAKGDLAIGNWGHSSLPMPSLNERMSEESLDDTKAFQDLVSTLHTSLRAHDLSEEIETLGTLEEEEGDASDEDEENEEEDKSPSQHPAVQVLDDLLAKVTDPAEKAKLLKLKRDHSDKIKAAIQGVAKREEQRRSSMEGDGGGGAEAEEAAA